MPAPQPRQRIRFDEPRWHVRNNALLRRRSSAKAPSEALSKRWRRDWASEAREKLLRGRAAVWPRGRILSIVAIVQIVGLKTTICYQRGRSASKATARMEKRREATSRAQLRTGIFARKITLILSQEFKPYLEQSL